MPYSGWFLGRTDHNLRIVADSLKDGLGGHIRKHAYDYRQALDGELACAACAWASSKRTDKIASQSCPARRSGKPGMYFASRSDLKIPGAAILPRTTFPPRRRSSHGRCRAPSTLRTRAWPCPKA